MDEYSITRTQVLNLLENTLKPLDYVVMERSNPSKFLEPEIYRNAVVIFDKENDLPQEALNPTDHIIMLKERVVSQIVNFDLFQILTLKELERGNLIEAVSFYSRSHCARWLNSCASNINPGSITFTRVTCITNSYPRLYPVSKLYIYTPIWLTYAISILKLLSGLGT